MFTSSGAAQYELGQSTAIAYNWTALHPAFCVEKPIWPRSRDGEAAAEFHLVLAQPCVQQRETSKARTAYEDFLTLWKDADADIPILIAAKAEYARLHQIRYSLAGLGSRRAASDES